MAELIIENWSDYDNRKIRGKKDAAFFSCEEEWEVEYLVNKIRVKYPRYSRNEIINAIQECCKTIEAPRPRATFVNCVLKRLSK